MLFSPKKLNVSQAISSSHKREHSCQVIPMYVLIRLSFIATHFRSSWKQVILGSAVVVVIAVVGFVVVVDISAAASRSNKRNKRRGIFLLLTDKSSRSVKALSQNIDCGQVRKFTRDTRSRTFIILAPQSTTPKKYAVKA